jgi:hypothetical protein
MACEWGYRLRRNFVVVTAAATLLGCADNSRVSVTTPDIDAGDAAAKALELYDANGDASLDKDELAKCTPLAQAVANYDANGDGSLNEEEISTRLERIAGSSASLTTINCTVTVSGRTLIGAAVKLRPVEFLGDALPPAEGTTDDTGVAHPTAPSDRLPAKLANEALVFPGLYHVEVTHPTAKVPAADLGCEIDATSRDGTSFLFDLKSN